MIWTALNLKSLLVLALLALSGQIFGEDNVIIKYKTYERVDLGNLEIKGEIIAPGDLSVMERGRKVFDTELLDKRDLRDYIDRDHKLLR